MLYKTLIRKMALNWIQFEVAGKKNIREEKTNHHN